MGKGDIFMSYDVLAKQEPEYDSSPTPEQGVGHLFGMVGTHAGKQAAKGLLTTKLLLIIIPVGIMGGLAAILITVILMSSPPSEENTNPIEVGNAQVSESVRRWEPIVRQYAEQYGIGNLTGLILALIMQESEGNALDVMQSSESAGLGVGGIMDPIASVAQGIKHFHNVYTLAEGDVEITLQSYNYGVGYVQFIKDNGGKHTVELAREFSRIQTIKNGYTCSSWRSEEARANLWCYGDPDYVQHVERYYNTGNPGKFENVGGGPANAVFQQIMEIAIQYQGMPYRFGGRTPQTSFDCSGLVAWVYGHVGFNLEGTAQSQYDKTVRVNEPLPGDLVFFSGTYDSVGFISHIGIYVGDNKMFDAGDPIGFSDLNTPYWKAHFVGYGRVVR